MSEIGNTSASDIPRGGWVDRWIPVWARPYIRLARFDRPIGSWLLLFPCWWSIALATPDPLTAEFWGLFVLFGIGAVVMRGAGCTYNDICDRNFDSQVARTRDRPLPSGEVTVRQAVAFMVSLITLATAILLSFNWFAIWVGVASVALVLIYPLMKRVTFWPQFFLGLAFNWGAFLGWAAVRGELALPAVLLYVGGIMWTLGYDTIYAHQDRRDDIHAGIKSTARRFGLGSKPWLYTFYVGAIALFGLAGYTAGLSWPFCIGLVLAAVQLLWQVANVDLDDAKDCLRKFKSNRLFGWLIFAAAIAGQMAFPG